MSLLVMFRPSVGGTDQTVNATPGILRLAGGTHTLSAGATVAATPGTLNLVGGTHTASAGATVAATPGILQLVGGTHTVSGDPEVFVLKIRKLTGVGL